MRNRFGEQLERLHVEMIQMGALCEDAISAAAQALMKGDEDLARAAGEAEREIDQKEREVENLCLKLLLQQQPVARDLREISSALKMISDLERIGDQAADIAELTRFVRLPDGPGRQRIEEMSKAVIRMVTDSVDSFVKRDLELAREVCREDDQVDDLFNQVKKELIGLIGPNGAGKTTLFNLLTGVYEPSEGKIELNVDGTLKEIGGMKPYAVTRMGLARTFQNIRLFKHLTALDNVKIAMHKNIKYGTLQAILRTPNYYREEERVEQQAEELLKVVHLYDKRNELASNLPYGEQRRLEIARALATQPKVLFLDEPAAGMNPQETADLTRLIHRIKDDFHLTVILIEHDMSLVMTICERIYVLDYGKCIANGVPEVIKNDKRVIKAYLGEDI